jgi:CRISPR/Cas system endoribonuclease Cas6 (RAMP superfamily)
VVGWLEASGELGGLMPALRLGEWVHVGSGTSMGMGRYRIVEARG